jgi:hypothetical protein
MIERKVACVYFTECSSKSATRCKKCKNNTLRNMEIDCFVEANDKPIPEKCPRLTYSGPAEQTRGYKCPVCGGFTDPYAMRDNRCGECGYKLNCC